MKDQQAGDEVGNAIFKNAARLIADARLLHESEREASAVALSVLALEEIGKYALHQWSLSEQERSLLKRLNFHRVKQMAIGALIMAADAVAALRKYVDKHNHIIVHRSQLPAEYTIPNWIPSPLSEDEAIEEMARALAGSEGPRFWSSAVQGIIEKVKHASLYVDEGASETHLTPPITDWKNAEEMINRASEALVMVEDPLCMVVAESNIKDALRRAAHEIRQR